MSNLSRRRLVAVTGTAISGLVFAQPTFSQLVEKEPNHSELIRLVSNENPYGPSESAKQAMTAAMTDGWKYAIAPLRRLQSLIAVREGVDPNQVIVTAGSGELLRMAGLAWGLNGGIVAARPTFSMLTAYAEAIGAEVDYVDLDTQMCHDLAAMDDRINAGTGLVYICNPNNPTGTMVAGTDIRAFIQGVKRRATIFVDEAYVELLESPERSGLIDMVKEGQNLILARTFSKIHGLAGLRVGYGIGRADLIERLRPFQMSFVNGMGLAAAIASYQDLGFQNYSRDKIREAMAVIYSVLDELGLRYTPSVTNFVMFDTGGSVTKFSKAMRQSGILAGRTFAPYEGWVRISMGTVEQMHYVGDYLRQYFRP